MLSIRKQTMQDQDKAKRQLIDELVAARQRISELEQTEEALRESEEVLRRTFEAIPDLFFLVSGEGIFLDFKGKGNEFIVPPEQFLGQRLKDVLPAKLATSILDAISYTLETKNPNVIEYGLSLADEIHQFEARILYLSRGRTAVFVRDITERKKAEETLRRASRIEATTTLAGGVAHDFNNLMAGVLGNAEVLKMRLERRPEVLDKLEHICRAAQRGGDLSQQLLAFARGGEHAPQLLNLNDIIRETLRLQERALPPRIRIVRKLEPFLWDTKMDPSQMDQVVMNLCLNAVEAINGQGRLVLRTENVEVTAENDHPEFKPGRYICLTVEDSGSGMAQQTKERVFEPFFTTKFQGRGLGLAAVYGIVQNHHGTISCSSEQEQGSMFKVYLPAAETGFEPGSTQSDGIPRGNETILVIDDELMILDVTQAILEHLGYHVLVAENGREAVKIARSFDGKIHLAILDIGMPVMGGTDAYRLLMKARPEMKVIISSGYELDEPARALLSAGASAFIAKPYRAGSLGREIRKALGQEPEVRSQESE